MNRVLQHAKKELERLKRKKRLSETEVINIFLDFSRDGVYKEPILLTTVRVPRNIAKLITKED